MDHVECPQEHSGRDRTVNHYNTVIFQENEEAKLEINLQVLKIPSVEGEKNDSDTYENGKEDFVRYYCNNYIGEEKLFLCHLSLIGNLQIKLTQDTKWQQNM